MAQKDACVINENSIYSVPADDLAGLDQRAAETDRH